MQFAGAVWLVLLLWYKKPHAGAYPSHQNHFKSFRWRIEMLDIGSCMGTVPRRQESVSNSSMRHRELLKWYYTVDLPNLPARALILKICDELSRVFFKGTSCIIAAQHECAYRHEAYTACQFKNLMSRAHVLIYNNTIYIKGY